MLLSLVRTHCILLFFPLLFLAAQPCCSGRHSRARQLSALISFCQLLPLLFLLLTLARLARWLICERCLCCILPLQANLCFLPLLAFGRCGL